MTEYFYYSPDKVGLVEISKIVEEVGFGIEFMPEESILEWLNIQLPSGVIVTWDVLSPQDFGENQTQYARKYNMKSIHVFVISHQNKPEIDPLLELLIEKYSGWVRILGGYVD